MPKAWNNSNLSSKTCTLNLLENIRPQSHKRKFNQTWAQCEVISSKAEFKTSCSSVMLRSLSDDALSETDTLSSMLGSGLSLAPSGAQRSIGFPSSSTGAFAAGIVWLLKSAKDSIVSAMQRRKGAKKAKNCNNQMTVSVRNNLERII